METPKTPLIKRYKSGIVSTEHIVESNTPTEAKSPSFPKRTDIIAELVALGIEKRKNAVPECRRRLTENVRFVRDQE